MGENDIRGIIIWAVFITVLAVIFFVSRRIKKTIEEKGIETNAVVSRIVDSGRPTEIDINVYVKYRTADGNEVEGLLSNPRGDLVTGQTVRIKYHPKYTGNARLV